jgi:hypothetical protein
MKQTEVSKETTHSREGLQGGDKNEATESDNTARIKEMKREGEARRQRLQFQIHIGHDRHVRRCIRCESKHNISATVDYLGTESRMHFAICESCAGYVACDHDYISEKMENLSLAPKFAEDFYGAWVYPLRHYELRER